MNSAAGDTGDCGQGLSVRLTDSTLRDGSHALSHQFTEEQVRAVVHALDRSNVEVIEVSHGTAWADHRSITASLRSTSST
jgi:isopropylmalate/homocitrate/citramalate synthase